MKRGYLKETNGRNLLYERTLDLLQTYSAHLCYPLNSYICIDVGSSNRKPISLWPGMYHSPVTNALWEARSSIFERLSSAPVDPSPPTDLIAKTPSKSRTSVLYKFSSDYVLREQYRNPWNEIRMGKLLEDLDALAGTISFKVLFKALSICLLHICLS